MKKAILLLSVLSLFPILLHSQDLKNLQTDDLNLVYYSSAHSYVVPHLVRSFENTMEYYRKFWDYYPKERITMFLQDFSDLGNGGATAVPINYISISIAPFLYVYEISPANERISWLMNHEIVHVIACDKASRTDRIFRSMFGGKVDAVKENPLSIGYSFLTAPRRLSPRWYHEGIAVFMETWMAGGLGRGLGAYDEMVFRTKILEKSHLYDVVGLESEGTAIDFQVGAISYLYGTRFFTYLANKFGPEKLIEWTSRTENSKRYFSSQFRKTFGESLKNEWSNWIAYENQFQQTNLDSIRQNPLTPFTPLSNEEIGSISRGCYDPEEGKVYLAIRFPGQMARIVGIDTKTGQIEKICDIEGASLYYVCSLTYNPATKTVFYTTDNNQWRDLASVNVRTHEQKQLISDFRAGDLAFSKTDSSIWAVRHQDGISTIIRIDKPYNDWTAIYAFPFGTDVYDPDVSPDGKSLIAAVTDISGQQRLARFDIEKLTCGDASFETLFDFDVSSPSNFVHSADGKFLFGSSYYTGVSNICRFDVAKNDMEILSNCESGLFRPLPITNDSLLVFKYTSTGFMPGWIPNQPVEKVNAIQYLGQATVENHPVLQSWHTGSPASINLDSVTIFNGAYNSWKDIRLHSAYPIVEGYKNSVALGYRFNFKNGIGFNGFDVTTSVSPDKSLSPEERFHLGIHYRYWRWSLAAKYNAGDFYDLFGPTLTSRKGYSLSLGYDKSLIYDDPRFLDLNFQIAGYGGLERLPDFQNIDASFDKLLNANVDLSYKFTERSLGAVDDEKGIVLNVVSSANLVNSKIYPRLVSDFAYGIALPINHSSIWFRSSAGVSFGDRTEPFANFYFGGFGNNWVDYRAEKRYQNSESFPGRAINDFGGTNFVKIIGELNLPPIRFSRLGVPPLYGRWIRTSLFSTGILTNLDSQAQSRTLANVGIQFDLKIVMFSLLESTLSGGYAIAFEDGRNPASEFMVSLKIL